MKNGKAEKRGLESLQLERYENQNAKAAKAPPCEFLESSPAASLR
jgi:hypothetical protein